MKGLIVRLWPKEAMPGSYFGLVRRLVDACPWIDVIKHSACIEGASRALARSKVQWGKMDAEKLVIDAPPPGKESLLGKRLAAARVFRLSAARTAALPIS